MTESLLRSMLTSLALTVVIECAAAWILGIRKAIHLVFILLANCITNPLVNLGFDAALIWFSAKSPFPYVILGLLEAAAVFAEFIYYRVTLNGIKTGKLRLSLILNAASFLTGLIIEAIMIIL